MAATAKATMSSLSSGFSDGRDRLRPISVLIGRMWPQNLIPVHPKSAVYESTGLTEREQVTKMTRAMIYVGEQIDN